MTTYLVEIKGYNPITLQEETLYYTSGRGFTTSPFETPPNQPYISRVKQAGSFKSSMFEGNGTLSGKSTTGIGEITLSNPDGTLDYLIDWGFDGRTVTVLLGKEGAPRASFAQLYTVTIQQAVSEQALISFKIRDNAFMFDRPIQDLKFQGTNALPNGLEGVPTDIMNHPKPQIFGQVFNITPVCVNTSLLIYAFNIRHEGGFDGVADIDVIGSFDAAYVYINPSSGVQISELRDKGVPLTKGADYANSSDMQATAPAAGTYRVCPTEGYARLGSAPQGAITADCVGTPIVSNSFLGDVIFDVVNHAYGVVGDDNYTDIPTINANTPGFVGVYVNSETTGTEVLNSLCRPRTWYGFNRFAKFRVTMITIPTVATSTINLTALDLISFNMLPSSDTPNGVPIKRAAVNYGRNYTIQNPSELGGSVTPDMRNIFGMEFKQKAKEDITILDKHKLAGELVLDSSCCCDTTVEANIIFNIYSKRRDRLQVSLKMRPGFEDLLNLDTNITITFPRFGYNNGKIRKIIGFDLNCENDILTLTLWG
jgi:hypothetical protein